MQIIIFVGNNNFFNNQSLEKYKQFIFLMSLSYNFTLISRKFSSLKMSKGKFIVMEGLDRSGKSTMTKHIQNKLSENNATQLIGYPNRTTQIGSMINDFLTNKVNIGDQAIHLLFSANRWESNQKLKNTLNQGKNIVCDRYWYSGVAYSAAKGLDFQWCVKADQNLVQPDLIIYLKGDPQILSKRAGYGQQKFERLDFQKKVAICFDQIFSKMSKTKAIMIDVSQKTLQEVKEQIDQIVNSLCEKKQKESLNEKQQ